MPSLILLFFLLPSAVAALNLTQIGKVVYGIKLGALWNLEQMSWCRLGISAGVQFNGYGCWCGRGGNGNTIDGIDACCQQHDFCYDRARAFGNCTSVAGEYISQYEWNCTVANAAVECADAVNHGCGRQICNCDKQLVDCWASLAKPQCKKHCQTGGCTSSTNRTIISNTNGSLNMLEQLVNANIAPPPSPPPPPPNNLLEEMLKQNGSGGLFNQIGSSVANAVDNIGRKLFK